MLLYIQYTSHIEKRKKNIPYLVRATRNGNNYWVGMTYLRNWYVFITKYVC